MKTWISQNWKQVAIAALSAVDAALIMKHPEWRVYEVGALTLLAGFGLHIQPVKY